VPYEKLLLEHMVIAKLILRKHGHEAYYGHVKDRQVKDRQVKEK